MSFVVRHKSTGRYLRGQDDWSAEEGDALQFSSGLKLVDYVEHGGVRDKLDNVEVVVLPQFILDPSRNPKVSSTASP